MLNTKGFNFIYYLFYLVKHPSILINKIRINIPELKINFIVIITAVQSIDNTLIFLCDLSNSILCIKEGKT